MLGLKNYINTLSGAYKKQSLEFLSIVENSMADSSQVSAGGFNVVEAVAQIAGCGLIARCLKSSAHPINRLHG